MEDPEVHFQLLDGQSRKKRNSFMNLLLLLAMVACVGMVFFLRADRQTKIVETPIGTFEVSANHPTGEAAVAKANELYPHRDYTGNIKGAEAAITRHEVVQQKLAQLEALEETRVGGRKKGTQRSREMCDRRNKGSMEECVEAYQSGVEELLAVAFNEDIDYCMKPGGKQKSPHAINCCGRAQCWFTAGLGCFDHCRFWDIFDRPSFKEMANCCGDQQAPEGCYKWNSCPGGKYGGWHTCNGGSYCIKGNSWDCAGKVIEGITTIIDAGLSIALLCVSGGSSAAVRQSAKAATKAATKASRAADAARALKQGAKAIARNFKQNVKDHFKDKGLAQDVSEAIMESAAEQMLASELDLASLAWDIAEVMDPTGITSVVRFYADVDECKYPEDVMSDKDRKILYSFGTACSTGSEYMSGDGANYRGCQTRTRSGKLCQRWTAQSPHRHSRTPGNYRYSGLGHHNKCRNPDGEDSIWCYTTDSGSRWEFCNPLGREGEEVGVGGGDDELSLLEGEECLGAGASKKCIDPMECLNKETGLEDPECAPGQCMCYRVDADVNDECYGNDLTVSTKLCKSYLTCVKDGEPKDSCTPGECKCERVVGAGEICMGNSPDSEETCGGDMKCMDPKTGAEELFCEHGRCECVNKGKLGEQCFADAIGQAPSAMICADGLKCVSAEGTSCISSEEHHCTCQA